MTFLEFVLEMSVILFIILVLLGLAMIFDNGKDDAKFGFQILGLAFGIVILWVWLG